MKRRIYKETELDTKEELTKEINMLRNEICNEFEAVNVELKHRDKIENKAKGKSKVFSMLLPVLLLASASFGAVPWNWEYGSNPDLLDAFMRNPSFRVLTVSGTTTLTGSGGLIVSGSSGIDISGGDITLENDATISNDLNNDITITENSEGLRLRFSTNNVELLSRTGILGVDVNDLYLVFNEISAPSGNPSSNQGWLYVKDATGTTTLYFEDSAGTVTSLFPSAGAVTDLDTAYNGGNTIDVDGSAVTLTVSDTDNNVALIVVQNDSTNDPTAMQITSAANAANAISLDIDGQITGRDIEGTGASFYVEGDGSIVGADLDVTGAAGITLQNDETITNATDTEFKFSTDTEDFSFDLQSNVLAIKSGSGIVAVDWGDLDAWTGVNTIAFDSAASSLTLISDGAAQDLTIAVQGATNSSLILSSSGIGADATQLLATAGGIDILASGAATGEDIDIVATGSSVNITATEAVDDAVVITASTALGGIQITSQADIDITTTGAAGEDITITNTGGSVNITATEADAAAVVIGATNAAGGMTIDFGSGNLVVTGTGASADMTIDCDLFSIDGTGSANISVTGGAGEDLTISQLGSADASVHIASAGTGADAISLRSTTGGVAIDAKDDFVVTVTSTTAADDLRLIQSGAQNASISLEAAGTGADAIRLQSPAGGLDIDAKDDIIITVVSTTSADDLRLIQTGAQDASISLEAAGTGADAIRLQASAGGLDIDGTNSTLTITNTANGAADDLSLILVGAQDSSIILESAGTGADAIGINSSGTGGGIALDTDDGAIGIVADGAANGDITIDAQDQITIVSTDADGTGSIYIHANGGVAEDIKIHADQGTATDSVDIMSDVGGITLTANGANGAGRVSLLSSFIFDGAVTAIGAADSTPDVSGHTFFTTGGANTYTGFDVGTGTPDVGQIVMVLSAHAAVFDTTASGATYPFVGSSVDLTTAAGDITIWVFDGTSWVCIQFTDISANNSGGV